MIDSEMKSKRNRKTRKGTPSTSLERDVNGMKALISTATNYMIAEAMKAINQWLVAFVSII